MISQNIIKLYISVLVCNVNVVNTIQSPLSPDILYVILLSYPNYIRLSAFNKKGKHEV